MATGGRIEWDSAELDLLLNSENGPVARRLMRDAERVTQEAKRLAPVSPDGSHDRASGYMRSEIGWVIGTDEEGLYADVQSPAVSPTGYPYPLGVEVGTVAHVIRSHGPYPLRDKYGNVYGHEVNHPGTDPQPVLRPSLEILRGTD